MAQFFNVRDSQDIPSGQGGCDYPAGKCRIATYYTALTLMHGKPACAGTAAFHSEQETHIWDEL